MIANPSATTATAPFSGLWVSRLNISFSGRGHLTAQFLPYNGTHLLLQKLPPLIVSDLTSERSGDSELDAMLQSLVAECQRQTETSTAIKLINVNAASLEQPVIAHILFADGTRFAIRDAFALAATDSQFGQVLQSALAGLARLYGTTYDS